MRVLFVLEDLRIGGAQRHALQFAESLPPGFEASVLGLSAASGEPLAVPKNVEVASLGLRPLHPTSWPVLARAIAAQAPDLVVTVNPVASLAFAATRFTSRLRAPWAVIFHPTRITRPAAWARTLPFLLAARSCDALVFVSEAQRRYWRRRGLGARRVEVILNGVDVSEARATSPEERAAAKARLGWGPDTFVFGVAAAMRPGKNLGQLVDALAALRAQGLPARLLIIGDGPERRGVEERGVAAGVGEWLTITGLQTDVTPYLDALDVGVLPSTAVETLSLSALEAMARGVPMILSTVGGAAEIVTDGVDGRLFRPGDTAGLISALIRYADAEHRDRMSKAAVETVRSRFD